LIGLDLDKYWEISPKWFKKQLDIYIKKEENRIREWDQMNHMFGKYISFAVNNPKRYPRKPFLEKQRKVEMTGDAMERFARRFTMKSGGNIK
jgi:hypothetical protein